MAEIANTNCKNGRRVTRETIPAIFDLTSAQSATRSLWTLCCTPAAICVCATIAPANYGVEAKATVTVQFVGLLLRTLLGLTNRDDIFKRFDFINFFLFFTNNLTRKTNRSYVFFF